MTIRPFRVPQGALNASTYDEELSFHLAPGKGLGNMYVLLLQEPTYGHDENMAGKR